MHRLMDSDFTSGIPEEAASSIKTLWFCAHTRIQFNFVLHCTRPYSKIQLYIENNISNTRLNSVYGHVILIRLLFSSMYVPRIDINSAAVHDADNVQKDDVDKTMEGERIQNNVHGADRNDKTGTNFGSSTFPCLTRLLFR